MSKNENENETESGDIAARWTPIDGVHPWPGNPRVNAGAVAKLAESIIRWGFGAPIIARAANGEIAAGHTRHKAAKRLKGMYAKTPEDERSRWHADAVRVAARGEVPVRMVELSETEAHAYALADNKLGEFAEWDNGALVDALAGFDLATISAAGWDTDDLQRLLGELAPEPEAPEPKLGSDDVATEFQVLITCNDESHQRELIELCQLEGWKFRALV